MIVPVVLKVLSIQGARPRDLARYRYAWELTAGLELDGVCRSLDLLDVDDRPVLVTEDIGARSLRQELADGALPLARSLEIAVGLADALQRLHEAGIVHRDLNPSNVVLTDDAVQIIDFDLATRLEGVPAQGLEGTLAYIPPEQTGRVSRPIDRRADLYGLGATLHELFCGHTVFGDLDPSALVHAHIAVEAPRAPGVPDVVADLVARLLRKNPDERYQSAVGVAGDLRRCARELSGDQIESFPLGELDRTQDLRLAQKLYGREEEIGQLQEALEGVTHGGCELVLVSGYSGIGKSALVHELDGPVVAARGRFVAGKFDAVAHAPYAAWLQLLRSLVDDVLGESQIELESLRLRASRALAEDGGALLEVVPELTHLVGEQPSPAPLPPEQARARLAAALRRLLHALASQERPLVLFLDDVQWAEPASLALLRAVLSDGDPGHLLFLAAYRSNEVDDTHPLRRAVKDLERAGTRIRTVELRPLGRQDVARWIADSLGNEDSKPLADALHRRTRGNPFFVQRMVADLVDRGVLHRGEAGWTWSQDALDGVGVADNVAELLASRIGRLDQDARESLATAACIGARVPLTLLGHALDRDPEDVHEGLWPVLGAGLLQPLGDAWRLVGLDDSAVEETAYRFAHDRVQEAAYTALDEGDRGGLHLRIGRRLREGADSSPQRFFLVVDQLNAGRVLMDDPSERADLARLNLEAGRRALSSVAFEAAGRYLDAGVGLVDWADYDTALALHEALALARQALGDDDGAVDVLRAALAQATTPLDEVRLLTVEVELHARTGAHLRCFEVGYDALRRMGQEVPEQPEDWAALGAREAAALAEALGDRTPEDLLDLPEMTDEEQLRLSGLLATLSPGVWANLHTVPVINPWLIRLFATHGNSDRSAEGYGGWAMQQAAFGQLEAAGRWGRMAGELADRRNQPAAWPSVGFVNAGWAAHWTRPLSEAMDAGRRGIEAALDTGTGHNWAAWTAMILPGNALAGGCRVDEALDETKASIGLGERRLKVADLVAVGHGALLPLYRLLGDPAAIEAQTEGGWHEDAVHAALDHYPLIRGPLYSWRAVASWILGDPEDTLRAVDQGWEMAQAGPGLISFLELRFFGCLASLALGERPEFVEEALPLLDGWAALSPDNHGSKPLLIRAMRDGDPDGFDAAAAAASHPRDQALCLEEAGKYWLSLGKERRARGYLIDARFHWARWGAEGKVRQLERAHPSLVTAASSSRTRTGSSTQVTFQLDAHAVLKSTRAISTEIVPERLLGVLLDTLLENAGAQRVALLFPDASGELQVEATASRPEGQEVGIARSVVNTSWRSGRTLAIADARSSHAKDPHIASSQPRSVLAHPVRHQNARAGLLYMENDLLEGAFSQDRIEAVEILSAQAAASLQIARMFEERALRAKAMTRFLPSEFLQLLGRDEVLEVSLGEAVERDMTVLFSDIRAFTARSEQMAPQEIFDFLNGYLAQAAPVIRRHGGFIDKYIGDAVMALFPTPEGAVAAGLGLLDAAQEFSRDLDDPLRIGVGIHRGALLLGHQRPAGARAPRPTWSCRADGSSFAGEARVAGRQPARVLAGQAANPIRSRQTRRAATSRSGGSERALVLAIRHQAAAREPAPALSRAPRCRRPSRLPCPRATLQSPGPRVRPR